MNKYTSTVSVMSSVNHPLDAISESLPYWAREYINFIKENDEALFDDLQTSGRLVDRAYEADRNAQSAFDQLFSEYCTSYSESDAKRLAESEAERLYIYTATGDGEPDEDLDEVEHLGFLQDLDEQPPL